MIKSGQRALTTGVYQGDKGFFEKLSGPDCCLIGSALPSEMLLLRGNRNFGKHHMSRASSEALSVAETKTPPVISVRPLGTGGPWVDGERFGPSTLISYNDERLLFDTGRGVGIRLVQSGRTLRPSIRFSSPTIISTSSGILRMS